MSSSEAKAPWQPVRVRGVKLHTRGANKPRKTTERRRDAMAAEHALLADLVAAAAADAGKPITWWDARILLRNMLTGSEYKLFDAIEELRGGDGICRQHMPKLAIAAGLSLASAERAMASLVEKKLIVTLGCADDSNVAFRVALGPYGRPLIFGSKGGEVVTTKHDCTDGSSVLAAVALKPKDDQSEDKTSSTSDPSSKNAGRGPRQMRPNCSGSSPVRTKPPKGAPGTNRPGEPAEGGLVATLPEQTPEPPAGPEPAPSQPAGPEEAPSPAEALPATQPPPTEEGPTTGPERPQHATDRSRGSRRRVEVKRRRTIADLPRVTEELLDGLASEVPSFSRAELRDGVRSILGTQSSTTGYVYSLSYVDSPDAMDAYLRNRLRWLAEQKAKFLSKPPCPAKTVPLVDDRPKFYVPPPPLERSLPPIPLPEMVRQAIAAQKAAAAGLPEPPPSKAALLLAEWDEKFA